MKKSITALIVAIGCLAVPSSVLTAEREMNVTQGPDAVFDEPVGSILPALEGATATNENGRIGNEFVFWGYMLADGTQAYFYACALGIEGVDCAARAQEVCTGTTTVVASEESAGLISRATCEDVCMATPGGVPCCKRDDEIGKLAVGLLTCE